MKSANWWYNLTWQQRCQYRELFGVEVMDPELIDRAYEIYT